jgi:uncharacterized protein YjiS (DUF1127 family)
MVGDDGEIRGAAIMTLRNHDPRGWFGAIGLLLTAIVLLVLWIFQCTYRAAQRRALAGLDDDLLRDVDPNRDQVRAEIRKPAWRA